MSEREFPFAVFWVSPRGFANEGTWLYGPIADLRARVEPLKGNVNAQFWRESWHKSFGAARRVAITMARADHARTPSHEICVVGACAVDDETGERDMQVVRYGWQADKA